MPIKRRNKQLTARQLYKASRRENKVRVGNVSRVIKKHRERLQDGSFHEGYISLARNRVKYGGAMGTKDGHTHVVRILFLDKDKKAGKDKITRERNPILVNCSCKAHKYYAEWVLASKGVGYIQYCNGNYPYIRNPEETLGKQCYHVTALTAKLISLGW